MKQLFINKGRPKIKEVSLPEVREGFAIVQAKYSFVSTGTERATIDNQAKPLLERFLDKLELNSTKLVNSIKNDGFSRTVEKIMAVDSKHLSVGYSLSGVVLWACPSTKLFPGDLVACAGSQFANHAEFVLAPKNLITKVRSQEALANASACAVSAIAINAFFKSKCGLGENVLVIGLGTLGSILSQVAASAGCNVFAIEPNSDKRAASSQFGVSRAFDVNDPMVADAIKLETSGHGVDAVFMAVPVASEQVFGQAIKLVRSRGRVVVLSEGQINFPREDFYTKEVELIAACSYGPGRYNYQYEVTGVDFPFEFVRWTEGRILELAGKMIESGQIKIDKLVGRQLFFADKTFEQDYQEALSQGHLGVLIEYSGQAPLELDFQSKPKNTGSIVRYLTPPFKTVVIGAGQFFQSTLMPILKGIKSVSLSSVVDQDPKTALSVGQVLEVDHAVSTLSDLFQLQVPDVAIVATDHASHGSLALELLQKGCAVFLEKPIAVTYSQLVAVEEFLNQNRNAFFCVDFNRSFSPHFNLARQALVNRATPCVVNYRVNALFLSPDHWVYRSGGRIVGEACHMIEFLIALVGSRVRRVYVSCLRGVDNLSQDNFYATFEFQDGSVANLCYTSLGNSLLEKEKIEVFWEGRSIVIDDFKQSKGFGTPTKLDYQGMVEKGHSQILNNFFKQIQTTDLVENRALYKRAIFASKLSFAIQDLVDQGGGVYECVQ